MKFSVWPNPGHPPSYVLALARQADRDGWFGIWCADHYMENTGTEEVRDGPVHECWAILPAIAAVTERLRMGPLVSPTSVHHPAVLANRASTLDHLSGGRFVLGLGAGWQINEHHAYGLDLEPPGPRVSRFEEAIRIIRGLLDDERTDLAGEFYTVRDAPMDPKPIQRPFPLLVGTASPRMLRITARHANEWNAWGNPERSEACARLFLEACEGVGRDPSTFHRSTQALVFVNDDPEVAESIAAGPMGDRSIVGGTDELVETFGRYAELGFDEFIVPDFTFGNEPSQLLERMAEFKATVIDQLT